MYFLMALFLAIILAIPTKGISILVFFIGKNFLDKGAAKHIIRAMSMSVKTGREVELYHINQAAIRKAFKALSCEYEEEYNKAYRVTLFSGTCNHPLYKNPLNVLIAYSPRSGTKNVIHVNAEEYIRPTKESLLDGTWLNNAKTKNDLTF